MDPIVAKIDALYMDIQNLAEEYIIREARSILKADPMLDEFIIGMGTWFFTTKGKVEILDESDAPIGQTLLADFLCTWDQYLRVTGNPMRFTATGEIRRDW